MSNSWLTYKYSSLKVACEVREDHELDLAYESPPDSYPRANRAMRS